MRKKILYITPHLSTGGLPQYLLKKIETFKDEFEISCIEWSNISGDAFVVQRNKIVNLLTNNFFSLAENKWVCLELISLINPDFIHFEEIPETFIDESILESIYNTNRNYKILVTTHSSLTQPDSIKFTADKFILVSEWSKSVFQSYFKDSIDIEVWEYPIEFKNPDKSEAKRKLGFEDDWKHVVNVGLFTPGKNQAELFKIAKKLEDWKIKFHFIGNQAINFRDYWGPLMDSKPDNCVVHGEKSNVEDYLAAADCFYFTSNFELNPLAVKEALSFRLPTFIKNLHTYSGVYDGKVTYITGDLNIDSEKLLNQLNPERKTFKLKACHLLIDIDSYREKTSINSMSKISPNIEYIQCVNERYQGEDWRNLEPLSGWQNHGRGHWGAFQSFKTAIKEHFTEELDGLLIFEADCVLDVKTEDFISQVNKALVFCKKHKLPIFSFGPRFVDGFLQSEILEEDSEFEDFVLTNKFIQAHCILLTPIMKDYLFEKLDNSWDSPDIFFNAIWMPIGQKVGILKEPISHQEEGMSMIDNIVKGIKSIEVKNIYNSTKLNTEIVKLRKPNINFHFIDSAFFEVKNTPNESYRVSFIDGQNGNVIHHGEIGNNCWISCNIKYWKEWTIKVERLSNGEVFYLDNNLEDKRVFICFESSSLGDNLAWIPYVEEFRKKHNCKVICSTFWNHLFQSEYPEIEFSPRGSSVPGIFACYRIGWFYHNGEIDYSRTPANFRLRPMQQTATDILGLDYVEIKPKIKLNTNIQKEKIVSIAIHGTCQAKYWNNEGGWQRVVDYIKSLGYQVILISKEDDGYMGNRHPLGIEKLPQGPIESVIEVLQKSALFIGIGSGLSWLSWAVGTPTVLISGFSYAYTEPSTDVVRIGTPTGLCSGCFNDNRLDAGDWNWCPKHKGTERQFECSRSITSDSVIEGIQKALTLK